jgi:hypothetical protein
MKTPHEPALALLGVLACIGNSWIGDTLVKACERIA